MPFQNGSWCMEIPQIFMAIYIVINMTKCNKMKWKHHKVCNIHSKGDSINIELNNLPHCKHENRFWWSGVLFFFHCTFLKLTLHAKPQKSSIALSIINVFWSPLRRTTPENILNMAISLLLQLCSCHLVDIHSNMDNMHTRRKRRHNLHSSHQSCGPTTEVLY